MSDFGELCPLFNTGVFNETLFPNIPMTAVSTTSNALDGTLPLTVSADRVGVFTFGRTVVVTGAFIRRRAVNSAEAALLIGHRTSLRAAITVFGSLTIPTTSSAHELSYTWAPFTISAAKTFTSSEILNFGIATAIAGSAGTYDLMIRYKEK